MNRKNLDDLYLKRIGNYFYEEPIEQGKTTQITLNPHYSNSRFAGKGEVEVWGKKTQGIGYDYSDRFWQWDYKKAEAAAIHASENAPKNTAQWVECFISHFYDKNLEVFHICAGVNQSNGYPYWVAGYKERVGNDQS